MANRRMFSMKIVDSDAFMDMSQTAQLLYFHLSMRADDDGFIGNPKKIMRMIGSGDDDMKILLAKRFLLPFESGIVVIKHWKIHNYIQSDRYTPTQYVEEKKVLSIKENGSYTDRIQDVSKVDTQVRLEIGKVRKEKEDDAVASFEYDPFFVEFWTAYPKKIGKGSAHTAFKKIKPKVSRETLSKIIASVAEHMQSDQWKKDNGQFIPHPSTFLNQRRWEDELKNPSSAGRHSKYDSVEVHKA